MSKQAVQLNELIEITRDGQRFYEHASREVKDSHLKSLFGEMSLAKVDVIRALSARVAANHEQPASGGTLVGKLRQVYADTRATLASDEAATYVAQLEEAEDRILHAFEDALESADAELKPLLVSEMPKVRACHDRMRGVKRSI
ncbi:ferritin-like domain-containing protein [Pseudomonas sp. BMS12]|uniref:ferritin-like domain-containing protein n=1 Tax=Pseudomonas sp. BMS12 TaxID=1796033 RepID=UPI00083A3D99|nr:PA2169 family four-helix-bundle protein [Pseudomonas sp. BMS12]